MDLIREWLPIITFAVGVFSGLWKISKTLNETLINLNYEIKRLSDSLTDSKSDRVKLHKRIDNVDNRVDKHDTRISILEDWRTGR